MMQPSGEKFEIVGNWNRSEQESRNRAPVEIKETRPPRPPTFEISGSWKCRPKETKFVVPISLEEQARSGWIELHNKLAVMAAQTGPGLRMVTKRRGFKISTTEPPNGEEEMDIDSEESVGAAEPKLEPPSIGIQHGIYTNCPNKRGRGCHVGAGPGEPEIAFRYTTKPYQEKLYCLYRRLRGEHWTSFYSYYERRPRGSWR